MRHPLLSRLVVTAILAFGATFAAGLAIILVTRYLGVPQLSISQITTNKQSTFDVVGESNITTAPDQAEVQVGVNITEPSVKAAQDRANSVINTINDNLSNMGIGREDIKTENYNLYPQFDYSPGAGQRITGYSVNVNLRITTKDFAQVNQIVDMATAAGANQISGITFTLSDEKRAEVEGEARKVAIDDAKAKAQELSQLAGMRLGKIVNVSETPQGPSVGPFMLRSEMAVDGIGAGGGAPTNIEPGSTTFRFEIVLSYETL